MMEVNSQYIFSQSESLNIDENEMGAALHLWF